ncbi:MAG: chromosome partitioning protein ParA, partial [Marivirga sp.]|nr:chromosome partitioning protein ParA [Marivirga sp.]
MINTAFEEKFLSIDIGGSRIKAILLDSEGKMLIEYQRLNTPSPATPERVVQTIAELTQSFAGYTRVSVGFPGYVRKGVILTA